MDLVTNDRPIPDEPIPLTFYPQSSSSKEASITLNLSTILEHNYVDELADKATITGMPLEDHFTAYNLLRIRFMRRAEKQQLLACRLMATATFGTFEPWSR